MLEALSTHTLEERPKNLYAEVMTLSHRNIIFKAGIAASLGILILIIIASFTVLPLYPELQGQAETRPSGLFLSIHIVNPVPWAPFAVMIAAIAYALITMILIFFFFEKTHAPEILFVAFFALSFAMEAARITLPLRTALNLPGVFPILGYRLLLFGRYFGLFSLFTSSVCASGLELQRQGTSILILTLSALTIALGRPVDGFQWDTSLCMLAGYDSMFTLVETAVMLITTASFVVSAQFRGSPEYVFIGIGSFLALMGRYIFLRADTWLSPLPGLILLCVGTWFICKQLHRVYLWL
jgi:hypothetical protein